MAETAAHKSEFRIAMKRERLAGPGLAPVSVIGDQDLVPICIDINSMRIRQRRIRALNYAQRVVIALGFSGIHADPVGVFGGDIDFIVLDIEGHSTGSVRDVDDPGWRRIPFGHHRENIDVLPVAADRKHFLKFRRHGHTTGER